MKAKKHISQHVNYERKKQPKKKSHTVKVIGEKKERNRRRENMMRRMNNLHNLVATKVGTSEFLPTLVLSCDFRGKIHVVGTPFLSDAFMRNKALRDEFACLALQALATVPLNRSTKCQDQGNYVDCRNIALNIDTDHSTVNELRKMVSQIVVDKGKGSRSIWGNGARVPTFWPNGIPFVNPATPDVKIGGKMLKKKDLQAVVTAFLDFCRDKIQAGYQPVNLPQ